MKVEEFSIDKLNEIEVVDYLEEDDNVYDYIIIVPVDEIHDSGYKCMTYLFCKKGEIICRSHACSDVIHIDGVGGFGDWVLGDLPNMIEPKGWKIDCLSSGYLRLFCNRKIKPNTSSLSDYEVYGVRNNESK